MKFNYVSLFSGIGGFEQALNKLGGTCVMASEIDKYANQSYEILYGHKTVGDITKVAAEDVPDHDVLVGGFPCQAFSVAGKRLGFEDTRGTLFFEIARLAKVKRPKAMILENVKGLVGHLSNANFEGALKQQIEKGEIFWQRNENSLTIKSDIAKRNAESYLQRIFLNDSDLPSDKYSTLLANTPNILTEKMDHYLGYGLTKRLLFLKTQISQTTKKLKDYQNEQIQQLGCKGDDLVLSLEKLSLTESLKIRDMYISEKTVGTLSEAESLWRSISAESYQVKNMSTTSTESNQTTGLKTFIYAMAEANIIASIIKHLSLSESLLRKVSSVLTKESEPMFSIPTLDVIVTTLDEIGYTIDFEVLNSKYFGVPQNRERIFIIALRNDVVEPAEWNVGKRSDVVAKGKRRIAQLGVRTFNFDWPAQEEVTVRLRDILESDVDERFYLSEEKTAKLVAQLNDSGKELPAHFPTGDSINNTIRTGGKGSLTAKHNYDHVAEEVRATLTPDREEKRQNGRRFKENDEPAFTLNTQDRHGVAIGEHPKYRIRKLTPRETFRLQGFADSEFDKLTANGISNSQLYKQAGNAVTVNVISAIGKRLLDII